MQIINCYSEPCLLFSFYLMIGCFSRLAVKLYRSLMQTGSVEEASENCIFTLCEDS